MNQLSPEVIRAFISVVESITEAVPYFVEAIKSHGELSSATKADLAARIDAAKVKFVAAAYVPRDI